METYEEQAEVDSTSDYEEFVSVVQRQGYGLYLDLLDDVAHILSDQEYEEAERNISLW
jgi:hypothetical protein